MKTKTKQKLKNKSKRKSHCYFLTFVVTLLLTYFCGFASQFSVKINNLVVLLMYKEHIFKAAE